MIIDLSQQHVDINDFIDRIEFASPVVTGITYKDGSGSYSVCSKSDIYDPEKGFAFALLNRIFGHNLWKDYVRKFSPKVSETENIKKEIEALQQQNAMLNYNIDNQKNQAEKKNRELLEEIKNLRIQNNILKEELDRYELLYEELESKFNNLQEGVMEEESIEEFLEKSTEENIYDSPQKRLARFREIFSNKYDLRM